MTAEKKTDLVRKISALLDKTVERGATEGEAKLAAEHAQRLMDEYGISLSEIEAAPDKEQLLEQASVDPKSRSSALHHVHFCSHSIAAFTGTRFFYRAGNRIMYFGFKSDVEIAKYLTEVFKTAMHFEWKAFYAIESNKAMIGDHRKKAFRDFCAGMARRLSERLDDMTQARRAAQQPQSTGRELMVVKAQVVNDAYDILSKHFRTRRSVGFSVNSARYNAGYKAGNSVNIPAGALNSRSSNAKLKN